MRPLTHILAGAATGLVLAPNAVCFASCVIGSVMPDMLDKWTANLLAGKNASWSERKQKWDGLHRTWSHNISYWIALLLFIVFLPDIFPSFYHEFTTRICHHFFMIAEFFLIGVLSHLVCDLLNPTGIGIIPFANRSRISLRLIKTNSVMDFLFGIVVLGCAVGYCILKDKEQLSIIWSKIW